MLQAVKQARQVSTLTDARDSQDASSSGGSGGGINGRSSVGPATVATDWSALAAAGGDGDDPGLEPQLQEEFNMVRNMLRPSDLVQHQASHQHKPAPTAGQHMCMCLSA